MKKGIALLLLLPLYSICQTQNEARQLIEIYTLPQLTTVQLSNDSLVPPKGRGRTRLGDESMFAFQYGRVFGKHTLLKAGFGFSTNEFSLVKYNVDDIFLAIFSFDSHVQLDSFSIRRVQYHLNYFDVPLTIAHEKGKRVRNVQLHYGLTVRLQFLLHAKASVTPDYNSPLLPTTNISETEKVYADDVKSFVISAQPYGDLFFRIYKGLSLSVRSSPFSLFASSPNKHITTSQGKFLCAGFSVAYRF